MSDLANKFNVKVGDRFSVGLEEDCSTGYIWELEEVDREAFEVTEIDPPQDDNAKKVIGGAVRREFSFLARKPGDYKIKLVNSRPWDEDNDKQEREYTVKVSANPKPDLKVVS